MLGLGQLRVLLAALRKDVIVLGQSLDGLPERQTVLGGEVRVLE